MSSSSLAATRTFFLFLLLARTWASSWLLLDLHQSEGSMRSRYQLSTNPSSPLVAPDDVGAAPPEALHVADDEGGRGAGAHLAGAGHLGKADRFN